MMEKKPKQDPSRGNPVSIDPKAVGSRLGVPAFTARPVGAPTYYGFPVLEDVEVDGFKYGKITDFEAESDVKHGDGFVVAPDGSRAGLVWEVSKQARFEELCPLENERWGVWAVAFPFPMQTRDDARRNLEEILPKLKEKWGLWKTRFA